MCQSHPYLIELHQSVSNQQREVPGLCNYTEVVDLAAAPAAATTTKSCRPLLVNR